MDAVRAEDITAAAEQAGLAGRPVIVHSSLRSFGAVDGGPAAVVRGLLDAGATLVVPTSTFRFCRAPAPSGWRPLPYNSEDDGSIPPAGTVSSHGYSVDAQFVDPAMGAVPAAVLRDMQRRRGDHPLNSFTAIGPDADALVAGQTPFDVYAPLRELVRRGGAVAAMGVGLDAVTLLHLAELEAGLRLLRRWGRYADGRVVEARHGGCSRGFERLATAVAPAERRSVIGSSTWRVYDADHLLELAAAQFRTDPSAGRCGDPGCARCRDQVEFGRRRPAAATTAETASGGQR
jgi:aminoglycoside 3-N-acetyltransferase